jgi:hypothetical protein
MFEEKNSVLIFQLLTFILKRLWGLRFSKVESSANKTYLYQQNKIAFERKSMDNFFGLPKLWLELLLSIRIAWAWTAEKFGSRKKASAGYFDHRQ